MVVNLVAQEVKLRAAPGFRGYRREQVDPRALRGGRINGKPHLTRLPWPHFHIGPVQSCQVSCKVLNSFYLPIQSQVSKPEQSIMQALESLTETQVRNI